MNIADKLLENKAVFEALLNIHDVDFIQWRPAPDKWNLLEIVCHLYDEERLDFKFRAQWCLEHPGELPPPFDPLQWVKDHNYSAQDFNAMKQQFLEERQASVNWLNSLQDPEWQNSYEHPKLGRLTAKHFIDNWLAHDYLHIRQINRYKYNYFAQSTQADLSYAGNW